jgi:hypothetical protein
MELVVCASCDCLVRCGETLCPFCSGRLVAPRTPPILRRRVRRAVWAAVGSVCCSLAASVGCLSSHETATTADASADGNGPDTAERAPGDSGISAEADQPCPVQAGTFDCSFESSSTDTLHATCDRLTGYCLETESVRDGDRIQCEGLPVLVDDLGFAPGCVAKCPTCACATRPLPQDTNSWTTCTDAPDGGGIIIQYHATGACYGSPPPRSV